MTRLPISRVAALRAGSTRYYTGKPCLRKHVSERHTTSGQCTLCSREDRKGKLATYYRDYRKSYNKQLRASYHEQKALQQDGKESMSLE